MMNNFFRSPFFVEEENDIASYKEHDAQYSQINLETEIKRQADNTARSTQYTENAPLGLAIDRSKEIKIAIDIGCGTGWCANLLKETKEVIYAIEPSLTAIDIAKKIHHNKKIIWLHGYAQDELKKLSFSEPVLFNSLCVLSHLRNNTVVEICKQIDRIALPKSILGFSENFGEAFDDGNLWKVRPESWWKQQFPGWEFDFSVGRAIAWPAGTKKDFLAFKVK